MIKANIKFFGDEQDEYGMPVLYHSYLVVASPWQQADSGVATAVPLSSDAPAPSPPHKLVLQGGPDKAYEEILELLRGLGKNKGLRELVDKE
jgi:hypothetical protein